MNEDQLFNKLSDKLTEVKTRNETLWQQHDERSKELRDRIGDIDGKIDTFLNRPCPEATQIKTIWRFVYGIVFGLVGLAWMILGGVFNAK